MHRGKMTRRHKEKTVIYKPKREPIEETTLLTP